MSDKGADKVKQGTSSGLGTFATGAGVGAMGGVIPPIPPIGAGVGAMGGAIPPISPIGAGCGDGAPVALFTKSSGLSVGKGI